MSTSAPSDSSDPNEQAEEFEHRLEELLAEAEQTVRELRAELSELRSVKTKDSEQLQWTEIERLETYLAQTRIDWRKVREYFVTAVREVRAKKE